MFIAFLFIFLVICLVFLVYTITLPKSEEEKEYERKQKEFLDDGLLTDPETGAKLTLEQAESGHWIQHDNEFKTVPESEIEKLYTEEQKNGVRTVNVLKESRAYRKYDFNDEEIDFLDSSNILSKYDDWGYCDSFKFENENGFVFLPVVEYYDTGTAYYSNAFKDLQLMFWIKLKDDFGHYYLREQDNTEKIFDYFRGKGDLKVKNYEVFTLDKTTNVVELLKLLKPFEDQKELEIEVIQSNLLIKNTRYINMDDFLRIEEIINRL